MTFEEFEEKQNQITDEELIALADKAIGELAKTGGKSFIMHIPPRPTDTDMVLSNLVKRFEKSLLPYPVQEGGGQDEAELANLRMDLIRKHTERSDNDDQNGISVFYKYHDAMIEYAQLRTTQLRSELDSLKMDFQVLMGCLGYAVPVDTPTKLNNGDTPENGIANALRSQLDEKEKEVEELKELNESQVKYINALIDENKRLMK